MQKNRYFIGPKHICLRSRQRELTPPQDDELEEILEEVEEVEDEELDEEDEESNSESETEERPLENNGGEKNG